MFILFYFNLHVTKAYFGNWFEQALQGWSELIVKEDQVEKEVLQKLTDPSKVHFWTLNTQQLNP